MTTLKEIREHSERQAPKAALHCPRWGDNLFLRRPGVQVVLALAQGYETFKSNKDPGAMAQYLITVIKNVVVDADGKRVFMENEAEAEQFLRQEDFEVINQVADQCTKFLWPESDEAGSIEDRKKN